MFAQATRGGDNAAGEADYKDYINDNTSDNDQSISGARVQREGHPQGLPAHVYLQVESICECTNDR